MIRALPFVTLVVAVATAQAGWWRRDNAATSPSQEGTGMVMTKNELRVEAAVEAVAEEPSQREGGGESDLGAVVAAAAAGENWAWATLTERFGGMVMAIARSCRLSAADAAEVHQVTWLRLVENIDRIQQPERIGAWLATTARRESLSVVRASGRVSVGHDALTDLPDVGGRSLDSGVLADERDEVVRQAFARLPAHCQRLLGILAGDDPPSYREISKKLSMPIGSIGPTRGRCLDHLRRILEDLGADI